MWRGGLGAAYRLPTLSSVGASLAPPCVRFHIPRIEPDLRNDRIRLSEKVSRCRPRKTAGPFSETDQAQSFMENDVRELLGRLPRNTVLATQPLAQPLASMTVHGSVGFADWSKTEVIGPPNQRAVELRYHHILVQKELISSGQLANRLADADHPLLRGNRTYVRAPCLRRIAATKRIP